MTEPEHYIRADPAVTVMVRANGGTWPGRVEAWRGDRVYALWNTGPGSNYLGWLDAADVTRV